MMGVKIHLLRQVDFLCGRCEASGYQGGVSGVSGGDTNVCALGQLPYRGAVRLYLGL